MAQSFSSRFQTCHFSLWPTYLNSAASSCNVTIVKNYQQWWNLYFVTLWLSLDHPFVTTVNSWPPVILTCPGFYYYYYYLQFVTKWTYIFLKSKVDNFVYVKSISSTLEHLDPFEDISYFLDFPILKDLPFWIYHYICMITERVPKRELFTDMGTSHFPLHVTTLFTVLLGIRQYVCLKVLVWRLQIFISIYKWNITSMVKKNFEHYIVHDLLKNLLSWITRIFIPKDIFYEPQ